MIKWLVKNTSEYRLETIEDVKRFEQHRREEAKDQGYTISNFSYAEKQIKEKGEVVDIYFQVRITAVFNELKNPEEPWNGVEYTKVDNPYHDGE